MSRGLIVAYGTVLALAILAGSFVYWQTRPVSPGPEEATRAAASPAPQLRPPAPRYVPPPVTAEPVAPVAEAPAPVRPAPPAYTTETATDGSDDEIRRDASGNVIQRRFFRRMAPPPGGRPAQGGSPQGAAEEDAE